MNHDTMHDTGTMKENGMAAPDIRFDPSSTFKAKLFTSAGLTLLTVLGTLAANVFVSGPASAADEVGQIQKTARSESSEVQASPEEVRPIGSALSERLQAIRGLVKPRDSESGSPVGGDAGPALEVSPGRARLEAIRAALSGGDSEAETEEAEISRAKAAIESSPAPGGMENGAGESASPSGSDVSAGAGDSAGEKGIDSGAGSIFEEVSLTDSIFGSAGDAEERKGAELLPVEVVYLDKEKAREAAVKGQGNLPVVRNSRSAGISAEDIPSGVMGDEFTPYPWYPKDEQLSLYRFHVPSAFLPRRRTTSVSYRFGKTREKAYDEFLGSQLVHDADGSEHSVFYSYALSDAVNFAAGISISDTSYTVNENTPVVQSYLNYRNLAISLAGQTTIGKAFAALPVSRTPSRKSEDVRLSLTGKLYTWDRFKTSMGCGVMSSRQKRKIESLVFYAGLPGLPITFEDIFVEYESLESYLVLSKVFARNLTVHAGVDHEMVRTSVFTKATKDTKSFTYPFAGIDLVLNDKAKIMMGIKDGEPAGELSYTSDRDMTYTGYFRREVQVIQDSANPFDNYNLRKDIDKFGVYLTHRFD